MDLRERINTEVYIDVPTTDQTGNRNLSCTNCLLSTAICALFSLIGSICYVIAKYQNC